MTTTRTRSVGGVREAIVTADAAAACCWPPTAPSARDRQAGLADLHAHDDAIAMCECRARLSRVGAVPAALSLLSHSLLLR